MTEVIRVFLSKSQKQAMNLQKSFTRQAVKKFCSNLMEVPFGIQKMSANIEGLVETSTNIGIVSLSEDEFLQVQVSEVP